MPPLPRLRVPALAELARQLRFTPVKAARRQIEAAEALALQVDAAATYPEDWIVFRLTGYRPEVREPALIRGEALLRDLSPLIEHLCIAAALSERDLVGAGGGADGNGDGWLSADEVCRRWRISRRTLDRYRRQGLLARRVAVSEGRSRHRLVFAGSAVEAFGASRPEQLARAAGFSRIEPDLEERIVRRATRYRARLGWSMGQVSRRLAERLGRSPEAIRQLLIRADAGSRRPIFGGRGADRAVQREVIERAYDRGCGADAAELAERFGLSAASVYRILSQRRAQRLRELARGLGVGPGSREAGGLGEEERVLGAVVAQRGLGMPGPATLAALLELTAYAGPEGPRAELARAAAYLHLRSDALRRAARLPRASPPVSELDEIETRLRWAARLKAEMVRSHLALAIKTIESYTARAVTALPGWAAGRVVTLAIDAVIEGVDRFDPVKGGRLAAPVSLALNRAVSHWIRGEGSAWVGPGPGSRASPKSDPAAVALDDFTQRVCVWQAWLEPDPRVRAGLDRLSAEMAGLLAQRYAWPVVVDGSGGVEVGGAGGEGGARPPQTLAAIGARRGVIPARVSRLEHRAMRMAMGLPVSRRGGVGIGGAAVGDEAGTHE